MNKYSEPLKFFASMVEEELERLDKATITNNVNYIKVLSSIPQHFQTDDLFICMLAAFTFGNEKGRECEKDMIKWNASATFQNMKVYHQENGCFPKTQRELWEWEKEYVNELEKKADDESDNNH